MAPGMTVWPLGRQRTMVEVRFVGDYEFVPADLPLFMSGKLDD